MACTDGVWSNLKDTEIAGLLKPHGKGNGSTRSSLEKLVEQAVAAVRAAQRQCRRPPASSGITESPGAFMRPGGRAADELRPVRFTRRYT
jgi:hypothetical protein